MTTEELKKLKPLGKVEKAEEFEVKPAPVYQYNGIRYDLRLISRATAEALANDPRCSFIAWKDEKKRPKDQRGVFAPKETEAAPVPSATAQADQNATASNASGEAAVEGKGKGKTS